MKFRKKPIVIEAEQWLGPESKIDGVFRGDDERLGEFSRELGTWYVRTLEGVLTVSPGDWIIRGVKNEIYPCKPDIFEATYEKVEDA